MAACGQCDPTRYVVPFLDKKKLEKCTADTSLIPNLFDAALYGFSPSDSERAQPES